MSEVEKQILVVLKYMAFFIVKFANAAQKTRDKIYEESLLLKYYLLLLSYGIPSARGA